MPPVMPVGALIAATATRDETLAEATPDAPQRPPAGTPDDRALVLALMNEAQTICRIANARGVPVVPIPRHDWGIGRDHGGLEVRGDLVRLGDAGYQIGAGQIYRAGQLLAAFSGENLAFMDGGRADLLV